VRNVLIGGLITLVVTLLVQVFVIPRVQRRTRKRERWENEVGELVNLIEVDIPTHLQTLHLAWLRLLAARRAVSTTTTGPRVLEAFESEFVAPIKLKAEQAYESLGAAISRAVLLQRRVQLVNPTAPVWKGQEMVFLAFNVFLWDLDPQRLGTDTAPSDAQHEDDYKKFQVHQELALTVVKIVSDPMKPPSTGRWRRARRWPLERLRLVKAPAANVAPSADQEAAAPQP